MLTYLGKYFFCSYDKSSGSKFLGKPRKPFYFTTLWIGWESTFCWQTTIPGVLENISCRWNDNSCSMILGVLRKYAFQSHTFRWTRPSGKPQTSAWLTVEDSFSAATTSKTEEQKRKRFFLIRPKHRSRMNLKCPAFITLEFTLRLYTFKTCQMK